jgi:ankyrin repeat protein
MEPTDLTATPLLLAIRFRKIKFLRWLLEFGADTNIGNIILVAVRNQDLNSFNVLLSFIEEIRSDWL